jgi:hypothetical protein
MYPCETTFYLGLSLADNDYETMPSGSRATGIFL